MSLCLVFFIFVLLKPRLRQSTSYLTVAGVQEESWYRAYDSLLKDPSVLYYLHSSAGNDIEGIAKRAGGSYCVLDDRFATA
jgi:hypothetical protein